MFVEDFNTSGWLKQADRRNKLQSFLVVLAEDEHRVVSTKAERVGHGGLYLDLPRLIRHIVQVALRVGVGEVYSGRCDSVLHGKDGYHGFKAPGRS